jgi:aminoglycoside 6'-N-acetyltransferase I
MIVTHCQASDIEDWARLRRALWPFLSREAHAAEARQQLASGTDTIALIVRDASGLALAFAEASLRRDYVNGCDTSPVGFLEGIYVLPEVRRRGIARALCAALENWAVSLGCSEFASDVLIDNATSHAAHEALGFEETERVVYYRKLLPRT